MSLAPCICGPHGVCAADCDRRPTPPVALTFALPIAPCVNDLWMPIRTRRSAKLVKRGPAADWQASAITSIRIARAGVAIAGPFAALIEVPETPADLDACIKPLLDACQHGGAIRNDKFCRSLRVEIDPTMPAAICRIHLTELPPPVCAPRRKRATARKEPTL